MPSVRVSWHQTCRQLQCLNKSMQLSHWVQKIDARYSWLISSCQKPDVEESFFSLAYTELKGNGDCDT
uniref:Uncharacterized protein n=1 Tax=Arundo donax TaxID=35708 RepID=A0A0A8XPI3_ARUDO